MGMSDAVMRRIARAAKVDNLLEILSTGLNPSDLQSLLLEVFRGRAAAQTPARVLESYTQNRFVRPTALSPAVLLRFDQLAFATASPLFEAIELAPVCPLGTTSALAPVDQNSTVATVRNTELVSDSTNVLALECAVRRAELRKAGRDDVVRLCASHRLLRAQSFRAPGMWAHFRLFALCSAGRDTGGYSFEVGALLDQLRFHLSFIAALNKNGYALGSARIALTDFTGGTRTASLERDVIAPLSAEFPEARVHLDPSRTAAQGYYPDVCFFIYATDAAGTERSLIDGGFTPWTQQLLSNRKERLLISGIGSERVCALYRAPANEAGG
jgi:hypothetical protein